MTERVEEIRQAHERWHAEGWSRQGCHQCDLLTALAQAERDMASRVNRYDQLLRERDVAQAEVNAVGAEGAARLAHMRIELDLAQAEVERLKDQLMNAQNTADSVRKQWDRERALDQAALARVRAVLEKATTALLRVSVTSSRYRSQKIECQARCTCDAIMDDKLVKSEISRVIQPMLDEARAALEGRG